MTINRHQASEAQIEEDLDLVADYIMRTMTDEQAEAFEQRLRDDEAFFDRVTPILKVWYSPSPGYTMAATRERVRLRELAAAQQAATPTEVPSSAAPVRDPKVIPFVRDNTRTNRRRHFFLYTMGGLGSLAAAGLMYAVHLEDLRMVAQTPGHSPTTVAKQIDSMPAKNPPLTPPKTPTVVAAAPTHPKAPPKIEVTEPAFVPVVADSTITIDSLPPVRAMDVRPEADSVVALHPATVVVEWEAPLPSGPKHDLSIGGIMGAVGDFLSGAWQKIRNHGGNPKPIDKPPPL